MSATPRAVVHIGPDALEITGFLECPRCGEHEELAPVLVAVRLTQVSRSSALSLVLPELPVVEHTCRLDTQDDQDPQPPFMDRGGVGFSAPLVTHGDGSGSRSSSLPGASGSAGDSRSTTGLDARSSRAARIDFPVFEADWEYWAFVQQIRARVNVGELEIDAILETAQMLSAEAAEREQLDEREDTAAASGPRANVSDVSAPATTGALWSGENSDPAADMQRWKDKLRDQALSGYSAPIPPPIVPFPSVHPAGRRLRVVPDTGNWTCPACGKHTYQITHSCHAPKQ